MTSSIELSETFYEKVHEDKTQDINEKFAQSLKMKSKREISPRKLKLLFKENPMVAGFIFYIKSTRLGRRETSVMTRPATRH